MLSAEVVVRALQRAGCNLQLENGRLKVTGKKILPCDRAVIKVAAPEIVELLKGAPKQGKMFL